MRPESEDDRLDEDIRSLLRAARRGDPSPPAFGPMWQRAHRVRTGRARAGAWVPMAASLLALVLVALGWRLVRPAPHGIAVDVDAVLASLANVDTLPLDFLLDVPGSAFVRDLPRFAESLPTYDLTHFSEN